MGLLMGMIGMEGKLRMSDSRRLHVLHDHIHRHPVVWGERRGLSPGKQVESDDGRGGQ